MRAKILIFVLMAVLLVFVFPQASYANYTRNITLLATPRGDVSIYPPHTINATYAYYRFSGNLCNMFLKDHLGNFCGNLAAGYWWKWWDDNGVEQPGTRYPMENLSALVNNVTITILEASAHGNNNYPLLRYAIVVVVDAGIPCLKQPDTSIVYTELDFWDSSGFVNWYSHSTPRGVIKASNECEYKFDNLTLGRQKTYSINFLPYIDKTLKTVTNYGILMNATILETYIAIESMNSVTQSKLNFNNFSTTATIFSSYSKHLNSTILRAYGATLTSANWNPVADINKDGRVNMTDYSLYARNYQNETWCKLTLNNYSP